MAKYFVIWAGGDGVIIQSEVETHADPHTLDPEDWMMLAAEAEDTEVDEDDSFDLFCVIDYPTTFYH